MCAYVSERVCICVGRITLLRGNHESRPATQVLLLCVMCARVCVYMCVYVWIYVCCMCVCMCLLVFTTLATNIVIM